MPQLSNYPGGFAAGITIRGVPLIQTHPGKVFWVDNSSLGSGDVMKSGSNGNKGTFADPFSTVAYAVTQARASKGDIIFVKPGHAETIAASTAWGGTAGVAIVGLGQGSNRPTFTFSATGSSVTVAGNNILLHNLLFISSIDAVVLVLNVSGADVTLSDIEYREDTQVQCTDCIGVATTGTRFKVAGFKYRAFDATAGSVSGIYLVGVADANISGVDAIGLWSAGFVDCRTTASTNLWVHDSKYRSLGTGEIFVKDTITASTGTMGPNLFLWLSANTTNITEAITGATFVAFGAGQTAGLNGASIQVVNAANEASMTMNWTQSTDA